MSNNFRIKLITEGIERVPNRAMLHAVDFGDHRFRFGRFGRTHHGRQIFGRNLRNGRRNVAPEVAVGGNIALIENGDLITIDADEMLLQVHRSDEELAERRANRKIPEPKFIHGVI